MLEQVTVKRTPYAGTRFATPLLEELNLLHGRLAFTTAVAYQHTRRSVEYLSVSTRNLHSVCEYFTKLKTEFVIT